MAVGGEAGLEGGAVEAEGRGRGAARSSSLQSPAVSMRSRRYSQNFPWSPAQRAARATAIERGRPSRKSRWTKRTLPLLRASTSSTTACGLLAVGAEVVRELDDGDRRLLRARGSRASAGIGTSLRGWGSATATLALAAQLREEGLGALRGALLQDRALDLGGQLGEGAAARPGPCCARRGPSTSACVGGATLPSTSRLRSSSRETPRAAAWRPSASR